MAGLGVWVSCRACPEFNPQYRNKQTNKNTQRPKKQAGHDGVLLEPQQLRRLRQEDLKFEAGLTYIVSSWPAWAT
jgi:hypothetical protein